MTERYHFADDVIAALNNPKRGFFVSEEAKGLPATKSRVSQLYRSTRTATRYVLDDNFIDLAQEASMRASFGDLLDQYKLVARPDDFMWIEWDEIKRQKTVERVSKEIGEEADIDWSILTPSVGYLFEDAPHTGYEGEAFIGTPFWLDQTSQKGQSNQLVVCPHSIFFAQMAEDPDESAFSNSYIRRGIADYFGMPEANISDEMVSEQAKKEAAQVANGVGGWWYLRQQRENADAAGKGLYQLYRHLRIIQGPGIDVYVDVEGGQFNSGIAKNLDEAAGTMINGDIRFLITVFSMLNYDWVVKENRQADAQRKYRYGKFHKGNSHIVLSIDLPKFQGVTVMPKGFGAMNESSRRQHSVRGHWRGYKKTGQRVWISPHLRGDPKLGVITKDYVLTHRR